MPGILSFANSSRSFRNNLLAHTMLLLTFRCFGKRLPARSTELVLCPYCTFVGFRSLNFLPSCADSHRLGKSLWESLRLYWIVSYPWTFFNVPFLLTLTSGQIGFHFSLYFFCNFRCISSISFIPKSSIGWPHTFVLILHHFS